MEANDVMSKTWEKSIPGETIVLPDGVEGIVVANFETKKYGESFDPSGWDESEGGLLIEASFGGLIRYTREFL